MPEVRPRSIVGTLFRVASARLRFVAVFAVVFAVIGGWETIQTRWDRWTAGKSAEPVTSSDTDFFCPMDPGVLSDWPSKCPVCNMTLVRRKRGDAAPLPSGVVARMQFAPYRLWLGGIRTAAVDYAPLARIVEIPGTVAGDHVEAEVFAGERAWLDVGQEAEVSPLDRGTAAPLKVRVASIAGNLVRLERGSKGLHGGDRVRIAVRCPVDAIEPFRSLPAVPPPLIKGEPRSLYVCMDHPDVIRDAPGRCPHDRSELMARPVRDNQRVRWWCPMHPTVNADRSGATCAECGGMVLVPRLLSFRRLGTVLAVPGSAVIDDGTRALVYVERGAGMFDATVVVLGPRCGDAFPVVSGLEPGDRVAAQGAFLIDAETRLTSDLASTYFGSAGGHRPESKAKPAWLGQTTCPVTGKPLGSMGEPVSVTIQGRPAFLCCEGCRPAIEADPAKFAARLPQTAVRP